MGVTRSFRTFRALDAGIPKWYFQINGVTKAKMTSSLDGDEVYVGLESYAEEADMAKTDFHSLQYTRNSGSWTWWAGQDSERVDSGTCGLWSGATNWADVGKGSGC